MPDAGGCGTLLWLNLIYGLTNLKMVLVATCPGVVGLKYCVLFRCKNEKEFVKRSKTT